VVAGRWKEGVPKLLKKVRLALIDISNLTDGLSFEIVQVQAFPKVKVVFLAAEGSVIDTALADWIECTGRPAPPIVRYRPLPDKSWIMDLLDKLESVMQSRGLRWRMHRNGVLKANSANWSRRILRWLVLGAVALGIILWVAWIFSEALRYK
jgi:hypothetical protein